MPTPAIDADQADLLLAAVLDGVSIGMAFVDTELQFVRANAAFAELTGIPPSEHPGRALADSLSRLPPDFAEDVREVFRTGQAVANRPLAAETPAAPGIVRHWLASHYPVVSNGHVAWVGTTVVEVTEWRRAQEAVDRLARLQVVTGALAEATTTGEVADIVISEGTAGIRASGAALFIVDDPSRELRLIAERGLDAKNLSTIERISMDADYPVVQAIRAGIPLIVPSIVGHEEQYPVFAAASGTCRSFAMVPLHVEHRPVGGVVFGWIDERDTTAEEQAFMVALGGQASLAFERARLYEAERAGRERMTFLAEASRVLSSSLEYEDTLARLADLAVPEVADACAVHLLVNDDLDLVVVTHNDADRRDAIASLSGGGAHPKGPQLLGRVAETGQPVVMAEVPDALWQAMAEDDEHLEALRSMGLHSAIVVPLRSSNRVLGVLTLATIGSSRRYSEADLPFVEDLASRAAVAIENARAHRARTDVARTLQQSLLPPHLPRIEGLELASRYHSAGDVEVGGDFYDVFPAGDGRWSLVMGDVCGKGVSAASLTALARYTVRAAAIDEPEPTRVLQVLNRAILEADTGERFCTIAHAVIEPQVESDGSMRVTLACGGHPLPLLVSREGTVREVGIPGTAIGLFEEVDLQEVDLVLRPGDALVLYTDGFVEVRSPDGRFAPGLLRAALAAAAGVSAPRLAEAVDRAVLAFEGGEPRDDMALLIVRVPDAPPAAAGS